MPKKIKSRRLPDGATLVRRITREINKKHGLPPNTISADPLDFVIRLMLGIWPKDIEDACIAGTYNDVKGTAVPPELRLEAAKIAVRYAHFQLSAQEISGPDGGPIPVNAAVLAVSDLMKIPEMRGKVEELSLALSDARRKELLAARGTMVTDTTAETVLDAEEES